MLSELPPVISFEPDYVPPEPTLDTSEDLTIEHFDDLWVVEGPWLQRLVARINFDDYESLNYFQKVLKNSGVFSMLEEKGCGDGDTVSIYEFEFDYVK